MSEVAVLLSNTAGQRGVLLAPAEAWETIVEQAITETDAKVQVHTADVLVLEGSETTVRMERVELPDGYLNHVYSYVESVKGGEHGPEKP